MLELLFEVDEAVRYDLKLLSATSYAAGRVELNANKGRASTPISMILV